MTVTGADHGIKKMKKKKK